jgi:hypothetical protein
LVCADLITHECSVGFTGSSDLGNRLMDEEEIRDFEQIERRNNDQQHRHRNVRVNRQSNASLGRHFSCSNQNRWVPSVWGETFQYPTPSCYCRNGHMVARCFVTQKDNANHGRYFYRCGCYGAKECEYFEFVDEWERTLTQS